MVFSATLIDIGIAFLLAVTFAEFARVKKKSEKGFGWIAASGIFFLFAGTFEGAILPDLFSSVSVWISPIFSTVAWILALIGTLFIGYETLMEK